MPPMLWIRAERLNGGSWMTYKLPYPFKSGRKLDKWIAKYLPGWEWVSACHYNPDEDYEQEVPEDDFIGPCVDDLYQR